MTRTLSEAYASSDLTYLNLTRLLSRLELNILSSTADLKSLQRSPYHRTRVGTNIEYARTLLLQLERTIPGIKIPSRKQALQTDLARKRKAVKILKEKLNEISAEAEAHARVEEDGEEGDEDGEDILGTEDKDKENSRISASLEQKAQRGGNNTESPYPQPISRQGQETSHTLRHRPSSATHHPPPATTTTNPPLSTPSPNPQTTESTLTTHRHEQETLTTSLLSLATQLKTSSQSFQTELESEKSVLARAVEGLDRNTSGMEAAGKRMGMLRRMSEGKGWLGRMMIYVWIFGLWVVALGIVFLGPKLRF